MAIPLGLTAALSSANTGCAVSASTRRRRVPVTTIASSLPSFPSASRSDSASGLSAADCSEPVENPARATDETAFSAWPRARESFFLAYNCTASFCTRSACCAANCSAPLPRWVWRKSESPPLAPASGMFIFATEQRWSRHSRRTASARRTASGGAGRSAGGGMDDVAGETGPSRACSTVLPSSICSDRSRVGWTLSLRVRKFTSNSTQANIMRLISAIPSGARAQARTRNRPFAAGAAASTEADCALASPTSSASGNASVGSLEAARARHTLQFA